jgi:hypothetical protein
MRRCQSRHDCCGGFRRRSSETPLVGCRDVQAPIRRREHAKDDARRAGMAVRLTVLEVNPARRFYERHGFVFTGAVSPRQHLEWRAT